MRWAAAVLAIAMVIAAAPVHAQAPPWQPVDVLRQGNTAATAGDWQQVSQLVDPLLRGELTAADLAEAHRLAGLAAFFQGRHLDAETHFVAYLRIDLDAQLDPSLYPPDVLTFFNGIKAKYNADLKARRPKSSHRWWAMLFPPWAQFENGQSTKGYILGGMLGTFVVANVGSYLLLRSWCTRVSGSAGSSSTCDSGSNHYSSAQTIHYLNTVAGVGIILTYAYGVYDGVKNYRRRSREASMQPFLSSDAHGETLLGVAGNF